MPPRHVCDAGAMRVSGSTRAMPHADAVVASVAAAKHRPSVVDGLSGFAQFCANRLVRRERKASSGKFSVAIGTAANTRSAPFAIASPWRGDRVGGEGVEEKALVFRIGLKSLRRSRRRNDDGEGECGALAGRCRKRSPEKIFRAGVDSEKNRD